jgi:hypothetical protein
MGAGIWNTAAGRLTVANSSFSDDGEYERGLGGGVYNDGEALVQNATFSGDGADDGGDIFNAAGGRLALSDSGFRGNSAEGGGAIENFGTTLGIANSSFSATLRRVVAPSSAAPERPSSSTRVSSPRTARKPAGRSSAKERSPSQPAPSPGTSRTREGASPFSAMRQRFSSRIAPSRTTTPGTAAAYK